jgi:hypothetical protein
LAEIVNDRAHVGMMIIMARGEQVILRATSCQFWTRYDELECYACNIFQRSSDGDVKRLSFGARRLGQGTKIV